MEAALSQEKGISTHADTRVSHSSFSGPDRSGYGEGQVAQKAMPYAFQQLERERNRQLQTARAVPSLTAVGGQLEDIQAQQQLAPQMALEQYYNTVGPIGFGLPQTNIQRPQANPIGMAAGGAMSGAAMGNMFSPGGTGAMYGAAIGGMSGLLGGLL